MFEGTAAFNQDIGGWDTGGVTDMSGMFRGAEAFNRSIGEWDTGGVTDMSGMFEGTAAFNQDIGGWDTGGVTDMSFLFRGVDAFNQNIGTWNTGAVENMAAMFLRARSFNQDIGEWDTGNVRNMSAMFGMAQTFDQNLGTWDVSSVAQMGTMLDESGFSDASYDGTLTGWSGQELEEGVNLGATGVRYCDAGLFRKHLIDEYSWTIEDEGIQPRCPEQLVSGTSEEVGSSGMVGFDGVGIRIRFSDVTGAGRVTVGHFGDGAAGLEGIEESNVSDYRLVIVSGKEFGFGNTTEVRFDVNVFGGIETPSSVKVYRRPASSSRAFDALLTTYDDDSDELVVETDSLGEFVFASDSNPLPIELTSFEGTLNGERIVLTWSTSSETTNAGFRVQRTVAELPSSEVNWETIAWIEGAGTTSKPQSYRYVDAGLPYGTASLFYRLIQVDVDGTTHSLDPTEISLSDPTRVELKTPFPNPASGPITVRYAIPEEKKDFQKRLVLYDMLGQKVRTVGVSTEPGRTEKRLHVKDLPSGTYFLRLTVGEETRVKKFTVLQ
jgi:surface protein